MRYVSLTAAQQKELLKTIGKDRIEELFDSIPEGVRLKRELNIPPGASESEILSYFGDLGSRNRSAQNSAYFLGAGSYHHFIPTIIDSVISRPEFYTSYTPYQAEVSQGTLQAIFEFQTLVCQLTGMEVANASLYDGASALAEAVLMAARVTGREGFLIPESLHPSYRQVLETYANRALRGEVVDSAPSGGLDLDALESCLGSQTAAVVVQSPNFFGVIEEIETIAELAHQNGALLVVVFTEALSLGLLKPPGEQGADIVVGEGQSFGLPMGFGGPYLGLFATRDDFKRQMPGRLAGETVDNQGRRGFVLTLSTREQHIRREKATSNICTNQGLCALVAAVFLTTLGKSGIRELAMQNLQKAHFLRRRLQDSLVFQGPIFNEMVLDCGEDARELNRRLLAEGIIGGLPLGGIFPRRTHQTLVCVTEQNSRSHIERFVEVFSGAKVIR